jgi:hypothetical protein
MLEGWLKLHEIVRVNEPEDYTHRNGEPSPSRVMHDGWCEKSILHATSFKLARSSGNHISGPFAFPTAGERNVEIPPALEKHLRASE